LQFKPTNGRKMAYFREIDFPFRVIGMQLHMPTAIAPKGALIL